MNTIFLIIVIVLVLLAVSDLIVGVSNDAVNFLNSAIGSKVAPLRVILIIAAMGILVGATFSNGMMEVARKGIFNPELFSFSNIMLIFLAVMLTDIILLDLFNTFGLPTSTTVSIVFELLGSAVGMAVLKVYQTTGETLSDVSNYINSEKALLIISGILLSVFIAFSVGAIVQYISRLIFSFNYKNPVKYFGAIWGGLAITSITYFILIKGAKGSTLIKNPDVIKENTFWILLYGFLGWTVISFLLQTLFKVNILKLIVLVGTFALAMAFAGNDLVNFIGVPLAGLASYNTYIAEGAANPDSFMMSSLSGKVPTPTVLLLIAGLIMVITLWLSKKSKSVVKTTLNLSDQDETQERFESSSMARAIVRETLRINKGIQLILPAGVKRTLSQRFDSTYFNKHVKKESGVNFDLIRASVNLIVASILIAIGTSLKLPLSTTYVTFMVAMGTSLADGAWDRESAVYRITGVVTVIGGWFFTALSAFTVSFFVVIFLAKTFPYGIFVLIALVLFVIYKTHLVHKKKAEQEVGNQTMILGNINTPDSLFESFSYRIVSILLSCGELYDQAIHKCIDEKRRKLKEILKNANEIEKDLKEFKKNLPKTIHTLGEDSIEFSQHYVEVVDYTREALHNLNFIVKPLYKHIDNTHNSFNEFQALELIKISKELKKYINTLIESISKSDYKKADKNIETAMLLTAEVAKSRKKQIKTFKKEPSNTRTSLLFLDTLNESKNMILNLNNLYKSFRDLSNQHDALDKVVL